jgi:hypothetical protein
MMIHPQIPSLQAATTSTEITPTGISRSISSDAFRNMGRPTQVAGSFVDSSVASTRAQSQTVLQERKDEIEIYASHLTASALLTLDVKSSGLKKSIQENKQLTDAERGALLNKVDEMTRARSRRLGESMQKIREHPIFKSSAEISSKDEKAQIHQLKDELKELETRALADIESMDQELHRDAPQQGVRTDIVGSLVAPRTKARATYREARLTLIHDPDAWSVGKWRELPLSFGSSGSPSLSCFQAAGIPYSSAAPRNRTLKDNPVVPNFHHTAYVVGGQRVFEATRSATFSEFGSKEREAVTRSLVGQMLQVHAAASIEKASPDRLENSKENPLVVTHQTIGLFTPDLLRDWGDKVFGRVSPADNEKEILSDTLKAHEYWNGKVVQVDGVWVKYDVRLWNIPNNKLAEKMPGILMSEPEANKESWQKMNLSFQAEKVSILQEVFFTPGISDPNRLSERDSIDISERMEAISQIRKAMLNRAKNGQSVRSEIEAWQDAQRQLLAKLKTLEKTHPEAVRELRRLNDMQTLHDDIQEIQELGIKCDPKKMDYNRCALFARVAALASHLDYEMHFGCRSGKDRTGLGDGEIKLLYEVAKNLGRMPSYLEQEGLPNIDDWRETMVMQSGNRENVRANLGADLGHNVGGSFNLPQGDKAKRYLGMYRAASGAQVFARP